MPVIAKSPPMVFGATPTPTPVPAITPTPTPRARPRVTPSPAPVTAESDFVIRHRQFISRVNELGSCFKREELSEFTDQEFLDHSKIAQEDKYIVQEKDMYCSMQSLTALTKALKRLGEE